eukprot:3940948-Rhodomonas_salina.6
MLEGGRCLAGSLREEMREPPVTWAFCHVSQSLRALDLDRDYHCPSPQCSDQPETWFCDP